MQSSCIIFPCYSLSSANIGYYNAIFAVKCCSEKILIFWEGEHFVISYCYNRSFKWISISTLCWKWFYQHSNKFPRKRGNEICLYLFHRIFMRNNCRTKFKFDFFLVVLKSGPTFRRLLTFLAIVLPCSVFTFVKNLHLTSKWYVLYQTRFFEPPF